MLFNVDSILSALSGAVTSATDWIGMGVRWIRGRTRRAIITNSGLMYRLVVMLPEDALADGWHTTEGDDPDRTSKLDSRLRLEDRMLDGLIAARGDGGAHLWLIVANDRTEFSDPLPPGPHELAAVHVVTRDEGRPYTWNGDLGSPDYGRGELFHVTMHRDGLSSPTEYVHASRLIYIPGIRALPDQDTGGDGYDLSAVQLYWPAVAALERAWEAGASLLERLSMPALTIKDTTPLEADDDANPGPDSYLMRLRLFTRSMATKGLMVLMGEDTINWHGPTVSGFSDLIASLKERISSHEGMVLTRVFGQAPAGLSTDDASGARTYYDLVHRYRRTVVREVLLQVYAVALGEGDRDIEFPPLHKPSLLEQAQVSQALASRDQILIASTQIMPGEARARHKIPGQEAMYPILDEAYDIDPADVIAEEEVAAERSAQMAALGALAGAPGMPPTPGTEPDTEQPEEGDEPEQPEGDEPEPEEEEDEA